MSANHSVEEKCPVTLIAWVKMPRSWSTKRALRCVPLFNLTGISMFIIITSRSREEREQCQPITRGERRAVSANHKRKASGVSQS
jgi:hypothetical protein